MYDFRSIWVGYSVRAGLFYLYFPVRECDRMWCLACVYCRPSCAACISGYGGDVAVGYLVWGFFSGVIWSSCTSFYVIFELGTLFKLVYVIPTFCLSDNGGSGGLETTMVGPSSSQFIWLSKSFFVCYCPWFIGRIGKNLTKWRQTDGRTDRWMDVQTCFWKPHVGQSLLGLAKHWINLQRMIHPDDELLAL